MRAVLKCRAGVLIALVVIAAGCEQSPTAPLSTVDEVESLGLVDWGEAGMPVLASDQPISLEHLFRMALRQVAEEQGADAARALLERVKPFHEAVRAAVEAGDREAFQAAKAALRAAMADVIIEVMGEDVAQRVLDAVAGTFEELAAKVAEAKAAGQPVARLERLLAKARALLGAAQAASDASDKLDLATQAAAVLAHVRFGVHDRPPMPLLPHLVELARDKVLREQGRDAVEALFATLHELHAQLRAAREAGDAAAVEATLQAIRAEQIRIVITVLGTEPVQRVLDATATMLADVAEKIARAKAAGRDVAHLEAHLRDAAALHADAVSALAAEEPERALDLALRAADIALRLVKATSSVL